MLKPAWWLLERELSAGPETAGANMPVNRGIVPHFMSKFEPGLQETMWAREIARHTTTRQKDIRHNEAIWPIVP
jgi:hypothetical protein